MANPALTRAIIWRRLAAVRRRLRPPARPPPPIPGRSDGPGAEIWLTPIVVDYFGRDGSTAVMKLLSSSSGVVVEGGYPFELEHFGQAVRSTDVASVWGAHCAGIVDPDGEPPRYYAEKMIDARDLDRSSLPPLRLLALLRDPRDTYVSIESFSRAVGAEEIGGRGEEEERLGRFVERQLSRLKWLSELREDDGVTIVRYEDLVGSLPAEAERLSRWLAVELDPATVADDFRLRWVHGTSPDPRRSVGRWRAELSESVAERLQHDLGDQMATLGFTDWSR